MNAQDIFRTRAALAWWLAQEAGCRLEEIQAVLREETPERTRRLIARGRSEARAKWASLSQAAGG